jgi:hypothetical protein
MNVKLAAANITAFTAQNPVATRLILMAVPVVLAAIATALTGQPVYACPGPAGGGCGDG